LLLKTRIVDTRVGIMHGTEILNTVAKRPKTRPILTPTGLAPTDKSNPFEVLIKYC